MQGEGNVCEFSAQSQAVDFQSDFLRLQGAGLIFAAGSKHGRAFAEHQLDQLRLAGGRGRQCRYLRAISQDGDPVADRKHVFQEVRDEDDALPLRLQPDDKFEQALNLGGGKRGGWLVENNDFRAAEYDSCDFDHLLAADGQVAHLCSDINGEAEI